ncbi:MAG: hypothetical protein ACK5LL_06455 [Suipraeoptans sp.]
MEEKSSIIEALEMGTWRTEMLDNEEPRMFVDEKMKSLIGLNDEMLTQVELYHA